MSFNMEKLGTYFAYTKNSTNGDIGNEAPTRHVLAQGRIAQTRNWTSRSKMSCFLEKGCILWKLHKGKKHEKFLTISIPSVKSLNSGSKVVTLELSQGHCSGLNLKAHVLVSPLKPSPKKAEKPNSGPVMNNITNTTRFTSTFNLDPLTYNSDSLTRVKPLRISRWLHKNHGTLLNHPSPNLMYK